MTRTDELNKQIKELNKVLHPLVDEREEIRCAKTNKKKEKNVGKCFKYHNSYGSGDQWWLYMKILETTDYGYKILSIQKNYRLRVEMEIEETHGESIFEISITLKEFNKQFDKILKEIKEAKNE